MPVFFADKPSIKFTIPETDAGPTYIDIDVSPYVPPGQAAVLYQINAERCLAYNTDFATCQTLWDPPSSLAHIQYDPEIHPLHGQTLIRLNGQDSSWTFVNSDNAQDLYIELIAYFSYDDVYMEVCDFLYVDQVGDWYPTVFTAGTYDAGPDLRAASPMNGEDVSAAIVMHRTRAGQRLLAGLWNETWLDDDVTYGDVPIPYVDGVCNIDWALYDSGATRAESFAISGYFKKGCISVVASLNPTTSSFFGTGWGTIPSLNVDPDAVGVLLLIEELDGLDVPDYKIRELGSSEEHPAFTYIPTGFGCYVKGAYAYCSVNNYSSDIEIKLSTGRTLRFSKVAEFFANGAGENLEDLLQNRRMYTNLVGSAAIDDTSLIYSIALVDSSTIGYGDLGATITADGDISQSGCTGVVFKYESADDWYAVGYNGRSQKWEIIRSVNGVVTVLNDSAAVLTDQQPYQLRVRLNSTSIAVYIDSTFLMSYPYQAAELPHGVIT